MQWLIVSLAPLHVPPLSPLPPAPHLQTFRSSFRKKICTCCFQGNHHKQNISLSPKSLLNADFNKITSYFDFYSSYSGKMIKHHSTTPNVHSCAYRDFSHNFWKMYVEVIDLNIFKNNKFVAKVDLWSFGVTSTHLLKCNIRSVLCLTNFPPHPRIEVLRIPPWFFRFPTQHSDIGQASYQRPFFFCIHMPAP